MNPSTRRFTEGANFPRVGWILFGMAFAFTLVLVAGWLYAVALFGLYLTIWILWLAYLFGRSQS